MRSFATCVASLVITATAFDFVSDDGGEAALAVGSGVPAGWPTAWWKESWSSTCTGEPTAERLHYQCEPGVGGGNIAVTCNQTHAIQRVFENETCSTDSTTGVVGWERNLCEDGYKIECGAPTPRIIFKVATFPTAGCADNATNIQYDYQGPHSFGCNLPEGNLTTDTRASVELEGVNVTSKIYLANDTTCSGESSATKISQLNVCTALQGNNTGEFQLMDIYQAPTTCSSTNHECSGDNQTLGDKPENRTCTATSCTDGECCIGVVKDQTTCKEAIDALDLNCSVDFVRDPAKNTTTCGVDATCTNELCCKGKDKKESGAFPSAPLAGMLVALCLHVGSAFA